MSAEQTGGKAFASTGDNQFLIRAAGNVGSVSNAFDIVLDTSAPTQVATITQVTDDQLAQTGVLTVSGSHTNDQSPLVGGTLSAALAGTEVLDLYRDGVLLAWACREPGLWHLFFNLTAAQDAATPQAGARRRSGPARSSRCCTLTVDSIYEGIDVTR